MNIKAIGRYVFRLIFIVPIMAAIFWLVSLTGFDDFNWYVVIAASFIGAWVNPKSNFAWSHILEKYGKHVQGISRLVTEAGDFKDRHEAHDEGFPVFTSISEDGLILYRGHLIPQLRETAVIPWDCLTSKKLIDRTPVSKEGVVDQSSVILVEVRLKGITVPLELPWNKEIELYTNILAQQRRPETANKSSNVDAIGASS